MKTQIPNKQLKLARRYATALSGLEGASVEGLNSVAETLANSPDLSEFLNNKLIKKEDKKDVVAQVFGTLSPGGETGSSLSQNIINLLNILVDNDKFNYFEAIKNEFDKIALVKNNIVNVEIISAIELDEFECNKITQKLEQKLSKKVRADYSVDAQIIAGLIIKIGDNIIDNSQRAKLNNLKKYLN